MTQTGRPRIGERVAVRLPDDVLATIDTRATTAGVSRAEAIRILVRRGLEIGAGDGVDRTQVAARLAMSPAERLDTMTLEVRRLLTLTGRAT